MRDYVDAAKGTEWSDNALSRKSDLESDDRFGMIDQNQSTDHPQIHDLHLQVDLVGVLRRPPSSDGVLVGEHRPHSVNCRDLHRIPADQFMICEFEGLLPNRNYTASVVAVNSAGASPVARFTKMCVTNYGPPSTIDAPVARPGPTNDTLVMEFRSPPEDVNGPIT